MSEIAHNPEQELVPHTVALEMERVGDENNSEFIPVLIDGSRKTYLVSKESSYADSKIAVLKKAGVSLHLLPSTTDSYTTDEEEYARTILNQRPRSISTPIAPRSEQVEALVYEPTTKSLLDIMIRSGHDTPDIRQARRAALRGDDSHIVEAFDLITFCAEPTEIDLNDHDAIVEEKQRKALSRLLDVSLNKANMHYKAAEGLDFYEYRTISTALERGLRPELVKAAVEPDSETLELVSHAWGQAIDAARQYNTESRKSGIYTELYRIGDLIIPVPAIVSTELNSRNSIIGGVDETSGHSLAQIYVLTEHEAGQNHLNDIIYGSEVAQLAKAMGFGERRGGTLIQRCRTFFDGETPVIQLMDKDSEYSKVLSDADIAMLSQMNIKTNQAHVAKTTIEHDSDAEIVEPQVTTLFHEIDLPIGHANNPNYYQMVLQGIETKGSDLQLEWAGAHTQRHEDLYEQIERDKLEEMPIQLNNEQFGLIARYDGFTNKTIGAEQSIHWFLTGSPKDEQIKLLRKIMNKTKKDIALQTKSKLDLQNSDDNVISQRLYIRETAGTLYVTL